MADKDAYGRAPIVIVEIVQPRCSNRFGTSPCTATELPKCYNCYWTCQDKDNYNTDGSITWRFSRSGDNVGWLYEETDANNIKTNAIPILIDASTTSSRLNVGASRTGESPLGRRATATVTFRNDPWDDHVGDFYRDDRTLPEDQAGFWTLFNARNPLTPNFEMVIYQGYEGQTLAQMQARRFDIEDISGPGSNNQYTIKGRDPLDRLRGKNTKYPRTSRIDLAADITDTETAIPVTCLEAELSDSFGNTTESYIVIGDEVIQYTGYTGTEPDFTLTGVARGRFRTSADSHEAEEAMQRAAFHKDQALYDVARYILEDHTTIPNSYIDATQWDDEGGTYLSTLKCTTLIPEPVDGDDLLGGLCRDGMFSIWWDDRQQKIPLLAVRPPKGQPVKWNDDSNNLDISKETKADERMTRVTVYFGVRDWFEGLDEPENYENRRTRVDLEAESDVAAGGGKFDNTIFSRWTQTFGAALLLSSSLLQRYKLPPEYATVSLDAKDRDTQIGDVIDLTTRDIRDIEGHPVEKRWQVIAIEEPAPGSRVKAMLQSYTYIGKFAIIMENDAPDYAVATDDEKLDGCWLADEATGLMPDGSDPYLLQ